MTIEKFATKYNLDYESLAERAAVIEYDGGETRRNAELMAISNTMKRERPDVRYIEWVSFWMGVRS